MNTLIIYDSHYGNTERIARTIADSLRDSGQAQAARVDVARALSLHGVDLLILRALLKVTKLRLVFSIDSQLVFSLYILSRMAISLEMQ